MQNDYELLLRRVSYARLDNIWYEWRVIIIEFITEFMVDFEKLTNIKVNKALTIDINKFSWFMQNLWIKK